MAIIVTINLIYIYYKLSNYYKPNFEDGINIKDKYLKIKWPGRNHLISKKDKNLQSIEEFKKIINFYNSLKSERSLKNIGISL